MKRLVVLFLFSFFLLSSCSEQPKDMSAFCVNVEAETEGLKKVRDSMISTYFNMSLNDFETAVVFISENKNKADEMAIFKAKNEEALNKILKAIERRIEERKVLFSKLSSEYKKLDNAEIKSNGLYCYYWVSDNDKFGQIINRYFIDN